MAILKRFSWKRILKTGAFLLLCQNISAQSFILNGTITEKDTGYAILQYFRDASKRRQSDTVAIKKGKFQFTGTITAADFAQLYIDTIQISNRKKYNKPLFITPGIITITFKNGNVDQAVIKGSNPENEYDALRKRQSKDRNEINRLSSSGDSLKVLLKNGLMDTKTVEEKFKEIDKKYRPIARSIMNSELSYIKEHPNSYVSLLLLYTYVGRISIDSIDFMYATLSDSVKGSTLDNSFLAYNSRYRKATAAEYPFDKLEMKGKAPFFTINNTLTNDSITVDDFKGKVVILEFWGLYCFPCLKANPYLEDIRKHYGKDKLEIIAINNNLNQDMPELISYINKNKLVEWIHVFTNDQVNQRNSLVFKGDFSNYSGLGVPRTVLIDKSGRVVYKNYGYSPEEIPNLKSIIDKVVNENIKHDM